FAQIALLAVALRTPLAAMGGLLGRASGRATRFAASAGRAAGAARLLNLAASAGPNIYVAAGVALAFFAVQALNSKRAIDSTIDAINAQHRAFGNNVAGYEAANRVLASKLIPIQRQLAAAQQRVAREASVVNVQLAE